MTSPLSSGGDPGTLQHVIVPPKDFYALLKDMRAYRVSQTQAAMMGKLYHCPRYTPEVERAYRKVALEEMRRFTEAFERGTARDLASLDTPPPRRRRRERDAFNSVLHGVVLALAAALLVQLILRAAL